MTLLYPELLLLAVPVGWVLWRTSRWPSWRFGLRALLALAVLLALAAPFGGGDSAGRDVVLLLDRSRSMPASALATATEWVSLLGAEARPGDRVAVLSFGAGVALEQGLGPPADFAGFRADVDPDGSQLADALDRALGLIPEGRHGSLLLISDGEYHGANPDDAVRRAALRDVRVDVRSVAREGGSDVAVESLELPEGVGLGELFQFSGWVHSDRATECDWRLLRGDEVIARGRRALRRGQNRLLFRDVGTAPGVATYRLVVQAEGDRVVENDRGLGVTRVEGRRPLLLVNASGSEGRLAVALRGAGLELVARAPESLPRGAGTWLEAYAGVILENVSAAALGDALPALADQVRELGCGLLVTGGPASFGVGGYYQSALDAALPVSMEVRIEHRKMALALAVVLDRSGSMSASVRPGLTKMDLANAGAIEAVRVLGAIDEITVIAVDSSPHVVVPLRVVDDVQAITNRISGIESMGGGIYTYTGLLAAAHELDAAQPINRHVILFADAADAEEPGSYQQLLAQLTGERNTTVSVVALGSDGDSDAAFLRDVAARGGGEIYFTTSPDELPRLFAQDTLLAARSSFVDQPTGSATTSALLAITSSARAGPWVSLPGYNLTYLRPGAAGGVLTTDEYAAPVVASMQAGLGRSAAFTGQVDGEFGIPDGAWPEVAERLVTLARWTVGQEPPREYFASVRREGRQAVLSVERDRELAGAAPVDELEVHLVRPDGRSEVVTLQPESDERLVARVPLGSEGVYRFAARTAAGETLPIAPLAVPYSPEFEPRATADEGRLTLGRLARLGRGRMNPPVHEVLAGERQGRATRSLAAWFLWAALALLLAEIVWRRWYERSGARRAVAPGATAPQQPRHAAAAGPHGGTGARSAPVAPGAASGNTPTARPEGPPAAGPAKPSLDDVLAQVKRRGRRR